MEINRNIKGLNNHRVKHYIKFLQHHMLGLLMDDLCKNHNFELSSPSSTYLFVCQGKEEGIRMQFSVKKNGISILNIRSENIESGRNYFARNFKIDDMEFQYTFHSKSYSDDIVNKSRSAEISGNQEIDIERIIVLNKQIKKDIFAYINKNIPELKVKFRKEKIEKVIDG